MLVARPPQVPGAPLLRNLAAIQINAVVDATTVTAIAVEPIKTVVVQPGQTIASLSAAYHVPTSAIQWGNQLIPNAVPKAGSTLLIPPGPAALVEVLPGETPTAFAARVRLDPAVILDYNRLTSDAPMAGGSYLQVPLYPRARRRAHRVVFRGRGERCAAVPPQTPFHDGFPYGSVHLLRRNPTRG